MLGKFHLNLQVTCHKEEEWPAKFQLKTLFSFAIILAIIAKHMNGWSTVPVGTWYDGWMTVFRPGLSLLWFTRHKCSCHFNQLRGRADTTHCVTCMSLLLQETKCKKHTASEHASSSQLNDCFTSLARHKCTCPFTQQKSLLCFTTLSFSSWDSSIRVRTCQAVKSHCTS